MWQKNENETALSFIKRMVFAKIDGTYTGTYSNWVSDVFGKEHSEDVARREYYGCKMFVLSLDEEESDTLQEDDYMEKLKLREAEIDKKRIKLADEYAYINRLKREVARTETIGEYSQLAAKMVADKYPLIAVEQEEKEGSVKGILCLSDWHYGLVCNNVVNRYDTDIAIERINKLTEQVIKDIGFFNLDELYIANLGDMISGIIHTTIRLENRIDVITQVIEVSELLSELISEISNKVKVKYFSVIDNHGRVFANKQDNLDVENFNRMIDFYIAKRFENNPNVEIYLNTIDDGIMEFGIYNWGVVGVHGHDDTSATAMNNLANMLHADYSLCLMGHRHSPELKEDFRRLTITNGCLCGSDEYAKKVRKSSRPSQNLIVVSDKNVCEYLHTIVLD